MKIYVYKGEKICGNFDERLVWISDSCSSLYKKFRKDIISVLYCKYKNVLYLYRFLQGNTIFVVYNLDYEYNLPYSILMSEIL